MIDWFTIWGFQGNKSSLLSLHCAFSRSSDGITKEPITFRKGSQHGNNALTRMNTCLKSALQELRVNSNSAIIASSNLHVTTLPSCLVFCQLAPNLGFISGSVMLHTPSSICHHLQCSYKTPFDLECYIQRWLNRPVKLGQNSTHMRGGLEFIYLLMVYTYY